MTPCACANHPCGLFTSVVISPTVWTDRPWDIYRMDKMHNHTEIRRTSDERRVDRKSEVFTRADS